MNWNDDGKNTFFKSGSNFISPTFETSVSRIVFCKTRLTSIRNFLFTQKLLRFVILSTIFDKSKSSEIGLQFWGSVLELFLESGLTYAVLQILGNQLSLTERLKSWDVGLAKILAVSFTNVLDKLLMPVALNRYKPFAILPFLRLGP